LDSVQAAVIEMENNPIFNAGKGSCLTIDNRIEMDASIMDGSTLRTGAIACISNVANPIQVARLVMDKSNHVLFTSDGALQFAESHGIQRIPTEDLVTEKALRRLANFPKFPRSTQVEFHDKKSDVVVSGFHPDREDHDTVGAVAVDERGNVAYATSTGGISAKMAGRVGDSPLVGCGGYADNLSGAISTTGTGEAIIKVCLAKDIAMRMEQGTAVQQAVEAGLNRMLDRVHGEGGCIAVDCSGMPGIYFTTEGMAWAYCSEEAQLHYGIYKGEDFVVPI
jgi:beta-aspartyl-peptidase (threonine type)